MRGKKKKKKPGAKTRIRTRDIADWRNVFAE
jgi:hypothetical protein